MDLFTTISRLPPQASQQSSPQAVWVVPALRQLHEITRSFIKQTYQKQDKVKEAQARKTTVGAVHRVGPIKLPFSAHRASSRT